MLSYIELNNFKSFKHIKFDLRGPRDLPKKMAFIYGENGSGKSNLMYSMLFISNSLNTLARQEQMKQIDEPEIRELLLEIKDNDIRQRVTQKIISGHSLSELIEECRSLNHELPMSIEIGFRLEGKNGIYTLKFDKEKVVFEELKYQIKQRLGKIFTIENDKVILSPTIFLDVNYKQELLVDIEKYWGKHTFLSIISNELETKNVKFVYSRIDNKLFTVLKWLDTFSVSYAHNHGTSGRLSIPFGFLHKLDRGTINAKDKDELDAFEKALDIYFTQLYSDIKKVYYKVEADTKNNLQYELILKKQINGEIIDVPFLVESTGTKKLLDIFPLIFSSISGKTVFMDEIDSGIHDSLMCEIVNLVGESLKGQFIATTHNTLLMKKLPIEYVYIICIDAEGNKEIVCIKDFGFRTHQNHNLQNKYLEGDYAGIPYVGYIDFDEIIQDVIESLIPSEKST